MSNQGDRVLGVVRCPDGLFAVLSQVDETRSQSDRKRSVAESPAYGVMWSPFQVFSLTILPERDRLLTTWEALGAVRMANL